MTIRFAVHNNNRRNRIINVGSMLLGDSARALDPAPEIH